MLTVIRTIVDAIAAFELVMLVLSVTIIPENRMIRYLREHEKLQVAFGIILVLGISSAIWGQHGF